MLIVPLRMEYKIATAVMGSKEMDRLVKDVSTVKNDRLKLFATEE